MSDKTLVERLREMAPEDGSIRCIDSTTRIMNRGINEAADRILALEAEIESAHAALRWIYRNGLNTTRPQRVLDALNNAFAETRAALGGENL